MQWPMSVCLVRMRVCLHMHSKFVSLWATLTCGGFGMSQLTELPEAAKGRNEHTSLASAMC